MLGATTGSANRRASLVFFVRALALALGLLTLTACSNSKPPRPAPPTYPVSGEIKGAVGKIPAGAQIEFRPENSEKPSDFTARGLVDASGKFTLNIPFVDRVLPGAIEGPHTVRILFPTNNSSDPSYASGLISIPEKFTVQPRENEFTIMIPKQP